MKTIGIISNIDRDVELVHTSILIKDILDKGGTVRVDSNVSKSLKIKDKKILRGSVFEKSDMIVCLGGDGTFLNIAKSAYKNELPLLGINTGRVGFLTELEKDGIHVVAEAILEEKYEIEERMMLDFVVKRDGKTIAQDYALNDVVISRVALSRILHVETYINNTFVDSFPGDGLIISSPTGSTAYSLSAGGPIVEPDIELLIVTPICPHILYSKSFITTGERIVKAIIEEKYIHDAMVTIDGQKGYSIKGGDEIQVKKANKPLKTIRINNRNFFDVLRKKIYERGEIK